MSNLESLLRTKISSKNGVTGEEVKVAPDFRVAVQSESDDGVHIIIHPDGHDGDTLDFLVSNNDLKPL